MRALHINQIGGGRVTRMFSSGEVEKLPDGTTRLKQMRLGTELSREDLLRMHPQNRASLIERGYITVWPIGAKDAGALSAGRSGPVANDAEKHVIATGFGRYNVIEGRLLNDKPLSKEEAYALAGRELPEAKKTA